MYKAEKSVQMTFEDFNQSCGTKLNVRDEWIIVANSIDWAAVEEKYMEFFPSRRGRPAVNANPAFRLGSYYFGSDTFDNSTSGGLANLETYAVLASPTNGPDEVSAVTSQVYLAQSPETFAYDDDGNMTLITTKTGLWRVTYNGENRPIRWERDSDNTTLTMSYDHMGRRREKNNQRFFYEGYLQVADNAENSYAWDCTEPVATRPLAWNRDGSSDYYTHDGNKNVSEVVDIDDIIAAHYEYAPFGAVTTQRGESAASNPWRFSSEYVEDDTATVHYNYRHYEPMMGRWLQRDPIGEKGGLNVFAYANNEPIGTTDSLGNGVWEFGGPSPCGNYPGFTVSYSLDADEQKCCKGVKVLRHVRKFLGQGGQIGPFVLDGKDDQFVESYPTSYAPDDWPEGPGIGIPFAPEPLYRFPWSWDFLFEAVCVKGPWRGRVLSSARKLYHAAGHRQGDDRFDHGFEDVPEWWPDLTVPSLMSNL